MPLKTIQQLFILTFLLISISMTGAHDTGVMRFSNLNVENGLSHTSVVDICQDSLGTIWFATPDGLCRFDGNRIRTYRHIRKDKNSLQSNMIHKIWKDPEDRLWACTSNGLSRYDAVTDNFHRINVPGAVSIEAIQEAGNGKLIIATRNATYLYNSHTDSVSALQLDSKPLVFYSSCRRGNDIVICTKAKTVETLLLKGDSLIRRLQPVEIPRFGIEIIADISEPDTYWIGTKGAGLLRVNVQDGKWRRYRTFKDGWLEVFAVEYDDAGRLWAGCTEGVAILDGDKVCYEIGNESLTDKTVRYLYKDMSGGMWVGTEYGGVCYWNENRNKFKQFALPDPNFLPQKSIVTYLNAAEDGTLWVGTKYEGLFHYFPESKSTTKYDLNDVRTMQYSDDRQSVFTGAEVNGMHRIDLRNGRITQMSAPKDIMSILQAGNNKLWLGTLIGLYLYDVTEDKTEKTMMPPYKDKLIRILTLFRDKQNHLWVGAKESLRMFDISEDYVLSNVTPDCLKNIVYTQCIHQDSNGTIWVGNVDGLDAISQDDTGTYRIRHIDKLTAATVRGIEEDSTGQLWVSTDNGLNRYNPDTDQNRVFNYNDGLRCSLFSSCAHSRDKNGNFFFGGIYGVETFRPESIKTDSNTFRTNLTELIVNNMQITPNDGTGILKKSITMTEKITLKHWQNSITIRFSCPNMISWDSSHYSYMLKGYDTYWTISKEPEATYTKIPKGKYTFLVKAANNDGVWENNVTAFSIIVKPIWYRSTFAIVLSIVFLLCGATGFTVRFIRKAIRKKETEKEQELQSLAKKYEESLVKSKIGIFVDDIYSLKPQDEKFLSSALVDIEKNIANSNYSVESLASVMCVSRGNLHLRMKSITGKSPMEIIRAMRMRQACSLLRDSKLSISEIAEQTGFDTSAYFITVFKGVFGETPGKYRSRLTTRKS